MKPVTCLDCGAVNTDQDFSCVRCGFPLKGKQHKEDWRQNRRRQKQKWDDEDGNEEE